MKLLSIILSLILLFYLFLAGCDKNPVEPGVETQKIAFISVCEGGLIGNFEIYIMNIDGSNQTNLTNDENINIGHHFSPDGSKIAFEHHGVKISGNVHRSEPAEIYVMDADGSDLTQLTDNAYHDTEPVWRLRVGE